MNDIEPDNDSRSDEIQEIDPTQQNITIGYEKDDGHFNHKKNDKKRGW